MKTRHSAAVAERVTLASGLAYPEGPVAMPDGSVIFVEVAGGTLKRVTPDGQVSVVADLGGGPNGAAVGPDGRIYVCNNGGVNWKVGRDSIPRPLGNKPDAASIQAVDPATGRVEVLYDHCGDWRLGHCNDLVFDADGNFWFTDTGKSEGRMMERGAVYWARADGSEIREAIYPLLAPNGVGLSPDGQTLYVSETTTARVWAWRITGPGQVEKIRGAMPHGGRFLFGPPVLQRLDSLAVSASGKVLVATLDNGGITEIPPDGGEATHYPFGTPHLNNLCFGGADLQTAYVTHSGDGTLTRLRWHEPGLRLNYQQLPR